MSDIWLPAPIEASVVPDICNGVTECVGDTSREIRRIESVRFAAAGDICFFNGDDDGLIDLCDRLQGATLVVRADLKNESKAAAAQINTLICTPDPRRYFIRVVRALVGQSDFVGSGVAPTAIIDADARISETAHIGAGAIVESDVEIGDESIIGPGAIICNGSRIGRSVTVQAKAVISCIGQSYERNDAGEFLTMPHFKNLILMDGARIGAGSTVVRGTLEDTVIGEGTIVGNLTNIGHNVTIGRSCHIGAGVIICGSSRIGNHVWISVGAIIRSVPVGDNSMVGVGAVVTKPATENSMLNGFPARITVKNNSYNERTGR